MRVVTVSDIRNFRDERGCSLQEAENTLCRQAMKDAIRDAETIDDLRETLLYLVDKVWLP